MLTNFEIDKLAEALKRKMGEKDELLNIKQVASKLGLTENAIRTRCSRGQIPHHKKHGNLYFSENEIKAYYLKD
ncbi:helix-turn-helix domain-containing protein [Bacteroides cellulosilyticus]|uniref:helix-turn-helix domain-containing protein n=1 Tax=Bacteroides cellulosilyticus TaxID=246787 RepID=UPI000E54FF70|nr:helix-turn-helix domain-containing protein [Bacteroides cellulosilyticus]RGU22462.1 DNA-binding protein [Bacteroides cellulosilyticus]